MNWTRGLNRRRSRAGGVESSRALEQDSIDWHREEPPGFRPRRCFLCALELRTRFEYLRVEPRRLHGPIGGIDSALIGRLVLRATAPAWTLRSLTRVCACCSTNSKMTPVSGRNGRSNHGGWSSTPNLETLALVDLDRLRSGATFDAAVTALTELPQFCSSKFRRPGSRT